MNLHGVDIYVQSDDIPKFAEQNGSLKLAFISNRGTKVFPPPAPKFKFISIFRCRFLSETEVSPADIDALVKSVSDAGYQWAQCQKLFIQDGVKQFSEPY